MLVYLMTDGTALKVGVAKCPVARRRNLQGGNPRRIRILGVLKVPKPRRAERLIHRRYKTHRLQGEWFNDVPELHQLFTKGGQYGSWLEQELAAKSSTERRKRQRERWQNDPDFRERQLERQRERWQNDPEYRERHREYKRKCNRENYQNDPEYRERVLERQRERRRQRMQDPEYRERVLEREREYKRQRRQDPEYRERERERQRERRQDPEYRERERRRKHKCSSSTAKQP